MKRVVTFPKQYKTVMALMPADRRSDYKKLMIEAIIRSEQKPPAKMKKGTNDSEFDV
jgi:hypothetical protein